MLINQKCLSDESVLKKIERFSEQGVERDFFVDGEKIAKITLRLTGVKDAQNWLSIQPNPQRYTSNSSLGFGVLREDNILHGRCIYIDELGSVNIRYIDEYGGDATGPYIHIWNEDFFEVGEYYFEHEVIWKRGAKFMKDGTVEYFDF